MVRLEPRLCGYVSLVERNNNEEETKRNEERTCHSRVHIHIILYFLRVITWCSIVSFYSFFCFYATHRILYGTDDTRPYYSHRHTSIINHPDVGISCVSNRSEGLPQNSPLEPHTQKCQAYLLSVKVNKVFDWVPTLFTDIDDPEIDSYFGKIRMKQELEKLGFNTSFPQKTIFVTCNGRRPEDKRQLQGLQVVGTPGFNSSLFPWKGEKEWLKPVIFDLSKTRMAAEKANGTIYIECRLWAKNIINAKAEAFTNNGVGKNKICLNQGKIKVLGENYC